MNGEGVLGVVGPMGAPGALAAAGVAGAAGAPGRIGAAGLAAMVSAAGAGFGAAVNEVARRVRASVVEVHSRGGAGAGTIWRADGTVVTNHHVLPGDGARIVLEDGREYDGRVLARDPRNDLAVLKVDARDLPSVTLGDARALRPGEVVLAIGNPAGVRGAVSVGVVNASLPAGAGRRGRELIQADVLLGPGSSGGPLTDARGRVVGINAMVWGSMALAVPSHVAARLVDGRRPRLGIAGQEVALPPALAARTGAYAGARVGGTAVPAVLVTHVEAGSAAGRAGLLLGDVLYAVGGAPVAGAEGLLAALEELPPGPVTIGVLRGGTPRDLFVPAGEDAAGPPPAEQPAVGWAA